MFGKPVTSTKHGSRPGLNKWNPSNVKTPSQEDLLGYVLGALDAQEQRDLQELIDQQPEIEEQLLEIKAALRPLDSLDTSGPRPGLARRTCEAVANWQKEDPFPFSGADAPSDLNSQTPKPEFAGSESPRSTSLDSESLRSTVDACLQAADSHSATIEQDDRPEPRRIHERLIHPSTWSLPDVLVGMALIAIVSGILFPTISYTRFHSRLADCQDNLRQVGAALYDYSTCNDGCFVAIPDGNLGVSGCFGPILKDGGFLDDDSLLACAGLGSSAPMVKIPSCEQIIQAGCKVELANYHRNMAGHYGYTMGYKERDQYIPPRNLGRINVVLVSDQPSVDLPGRRSANHGGHGQNCLFEDGHVGYVVGHILGNDALFENDYGYVGPGTHAADNVIAPSHLAPVELVKSKVAE